jgi:hypothetical protein
MHWMGLVLQSVYAFFSSTIQTEPGFLSLPLFEVWYFIDTARLQYLLLCHLSLLFSPFLKTTVYLVLF